MKYKIERGSSSKTFESHRLTVSAFTKWAFTHLGFGQVHHCLTSVIWQVVNYKTLKQNLEDNLSIRCPTYKTLLNPVMSFKF